MSLNPDFIILIDALRHDYISAEHTPFLFAQKQNSIRADVIETFAFQTRPAYLAGLKPVESDICHLFEFNPESSPFKYLSKIAWALKPFDSRILRSIIRRIARRVERKNGFQASADVMSCAHIPIELLKFFALSERRYTDAANAFGTHKSVFDLLREAGRKWAWIGYPRHYGSSKNILDRYYNSPGYDLYYLHFSELDWVGHRFGPNSSELKVALRELDSHLEQLLSTPIANGARACIFGDHGMVQVEGTLDLRSKVAALPFRLGTDFLYFLDSTQARFWFFNQEAKTAITKLLASLEVGHILAEPEREKLGINFSHRKYGDLIFMLDAPYVLHPSFFTANSEPAPKGMHGYLPAMRDNATQVMILGAGTRELATIEMTEIFGLIREYLV